MHARAAGVGPSLGQLAAGAAALLLLAGAAVAGPELVVPPEAQWSANFDVDRATQAWLATLPAAQRAQSDAYFEGGYWLLLWNLLLNLGVCWLLLAGGFSVRMRSWSERVSRRRWVRAALYGGAFVLVFSLLTFPLGVWENWARERLYGLSDQGFLAWLGDQGIGLGIGIVVGALMVPVVTAFLRHAGSSWWAWTGLVSIAFMAFFMAIFPVVVAPLFNHYEHMAPGPLRDSILSLARSHEVPSGEVYTFDASRQTNRMSANVSGLFGTARISMNDNLLKGASPAEVRAVVGHETGHYVLHHVFKLLLEIGLLILVALWLVHVVLERILARWGGGWGLRDRADTAAMPLVFALFSVVMFLATPVSNTIVRTSESEADIFGLDAVREPQAFASVAIRLSTYRKLRPGPLEEIVFYDHPSGEARIRMAMRWLRENPPASAAAAP